MGLTRHVLRTVAAAAALAALAACSSPGQHAGGRPAAVSPSGVAASSPAPTGSATSSPPGSATPSSCSVITSAQASEALGQPVRPPILGKAFVEGGKACVFYGPAVPAGFDPDVPIGDSVRVVLVTGPDAKKWFEDYRHMVRAQPISGLGDEAYYDGFASLSVLKGDAYLRIAVGIASNLSAEEKLARDALPLM